MHPRRSPSVQEEGLATNTSLTMVSLENSRKSEAQTHSSERLVFETEECINAV